MLPHPCCVALTKTSVTTSHPSAKIAALIAISCETGGHSGRHHRMPAAGVPQAPRGPLPRPHLSPSVSRPPRSFAAILHPSPGPLSPPGCRAPQFDHVTWQVLRPIPPGEFLRLGRCLGFLADPGRLQAKFVGDPVGTASLVSGHCRVHHHRADPTASCEGLCPRSAFSQTSACPATSPGYWVPGDRGYSNHFHPVEQIRRHFGLQGSPGGPHREARRPKRNPKIGHHLAWRRTAASTPAARLRRGALPGRQTTSTLPRLPDQDRKRAGLGWEPPAQHRVSSKPAARHPPGRWPGAGSWCLGTLGSPGYQGGLPLSQFPHEARN